MHTYAEHRADRSRLWAELRQVTGLDAPVSNTEPVRAAIYKAVVANFNLSGFTVELTAVREDGAVFIVHYGAVRLYGAYKKNKLTRIARTSIFADRADRDEALTKGPRTAAALLENLIDTRARQGRQSAN